MVNEKDFENFVFLQALENAVSFKGKANPKVLIGRVIPKFPEIKKDMQHYMGQIDNIVSQVNLLGLEKQKKKISELNPNFFTKSEKKEEKKKDTLPELKNVKGPIRVRTEPAPSGYLHLGHAYNIVFNSEYIKRYGGKFILRFGDTNPENIDIKNYERILEDVKWLTQDSIDEIYYQSDRMEFYYKYIRELIEKKHAYVCECESEIFREFNEMSKECPHREQHIDKQVELFEKMMNGEIESGDAVIRFKADLQNKNPALRDFSIARINTKPHARVGKKYRIWPLMNLSVAIDDALMKMTHVIRGKDHEINTEKQKMIHKALGMPSPEYYHIGRIKFVDINLSKTDLTNKIKEGIYEGWDDPRVPTLLSYRKRGFKAEAFRNMIIAGGMSKRDSKISKTEYHKSLNFFNKQILEKEADRFFFVSKPKKIHIENITDFPKKEFLLLKHPDFKERGSRHIKINSDYFIDNIDFKEIKKGDLIRLMHFANFIVLKKEKDKITLKISSIEYSKDIDIKKNIHFVPTENKKCKIIMNDNSTITGICEEIGQIKKETPIQFERFGFVKFENQDKDKLIFYFTQR